MIALWCVTKSGFYMTTSDWLPAQWLDREEAPSVSVSCSAVPNSLKPHGLDLRLSPGSVTTELNRTMSWIACCVEKYLCLVSEVSHTHTRKWATVFRTVLSSRRNTKVEFFFTSSFELLSISGVLLILHHFSQLCPYICSIPEKMLNHLYSTTSPLHNKNLYLVRADFTSKGKS